MTERPNVCYSPLIAKHPDRPAAAAAQPDERITLLHRWSEFCGADCRGTARHFSAAMAAKLTNCSPQTQTDGRSIWQIKRTRRKQAWWPYNIAGLNLFSDLCCTLSSPHLYLYCFSSHLRLQHTIPDNQDEPYKNSINPEKPHLSELLLLLCFQVFCSCSGVLYVFFFFSLPKFPQLQKYDFLSICRFSGDGIAGKVYFGDRRRQGVRSQRRERMKCF